MKKKATLAVLLAMTAMMGMTGCGKDSDKKTDDKPASDVITESTTNTGLDSIADVGTDAIVDAETPTNVYANKLGLSLHECNSQYSYEEYQITSLLGDVSDMQAAGDCLVFKTDSGIYVFGIDPDDDRDAMKAAHGLVKLTDRTDVDIVATSHWNVLCKDANGEYLVYYTSGEYGSFNDYSYANGSVEEYNIGKLPIETVISMDDGMGHHMYMTTVNSETGRIEFYIPEGYKRDGSYKVIDYDGDLYENSYNTSKHTGFGMKTAYEDAQAIDDDTTRVEYNISSWVTTFGDDFYFLADNKIYCMPATFGKSAIYELIVRDYALNDDGYSVGPISNEIYNVENVETLYKMNSNDITSAYNVVFTKIDDESNLYAIHKNTSDDTMITYDLSGIGHTKSDIKNVYSSGKNVWVEFSNNDVYNIRISSKGEVESVEINQSLTDALNEGKVKKMFANDGDLLVLDNNNLVYNISN